MTCLAATIACLTPTLAWAPGRIILAAALLAVALIFIVIVGVFLRRALLGGSSQGVDHGVSLEKMRRLHEAGELSDEEFAAVKDSLARKIQQRKSENGQR